MRQLIERLDNFLVSEGNIHHREMSFGQEASVNMHMSTMRTLERYAKESGEHKRYKAAIEAHKKAMEMFRNLKEGKGLVKAIRAAKKAAKEAHILTRRSE